MILLSRQVTPEGGPMETFGKLFASLLTFIYHCFDRIVIQGYLPLLVREENIVHFFRDVQGIYPITSQVLKKRTQEYKRWVEGYARNHKIPMEWAQKGVRKEDYVVPYRRRMEHQNRHGVYFIFQSMEQGSTFRSLNPKIRKPRSELPAYPQAILALYPFLLLHPG
jgi:hypothetical protein